MTMTDPAAREAEIDEFARAKLIEQLQAIAPGLFILPQTRTAMVDFILKRDAAAHDAAEKRAEEMATALREIAEAKPKTNAGTNVQLIWDLAAIARAALAQETP